MRYHPDYLERSEREGSAVGFNVTSGLPTTRPARKAEAFICRISVQRPGTLGMLRCEFLGPNSLRLFFDSRQRREIVTAI